MTSSTVEIRSGIRFRQLEFCPCCTATEAQKLLTNGPDFESQLGQFNVYMCRTCGIGFTSPQPISEDIFKLYDNRSSHDFDESFAFVGWLRKLNNFRQLKRLPPQKREQQVTALDYGCGAGFFTRSMRQFLKGRVIGSDFHATPPALIAATSGIEYVSDEDLERFQQQLDVIVCRNVLEHTVDPVGFLDRLRKLLKPGGVLLVEVPNRRSIWMTIMGRYSFNYYLPRHLFHYDENSLTTHLQGFRIVGMWRDHSPILGKSIGNLLGVKISGFGLLGLFLLPEQFLIDFILGRSSQLVVVAERIA